MVLAMASAALRSDLFNLANLRGAFAGEFRRWDEAVERGDTALAKHARASVRAIAFRGLSEGSARMGGFYFFLDPSREGGLSGVNYIGIADRPDRPIGRRIVDRLRDDSALDTTLDRAAPQVARRIVTGRLVCALPRSGQNYVTKHLRVAELFRRSPGIILVGCEGPRELIRETEKSLIGSAAAADAPLFNVQHLGFRGTVSKAAMELAKAAIDEARAHGLSAAAAEVWKSQLN
jgi:hypothetical protein